MQHLSDSAQYVKGVGPQRLKLFHRCGIFTVGDLLYYFPRRYEDRSCIKAISKVNIGDFETVQGEIRTLGIRSTKSKLNIFQLAVSDGTGVIYATWFNQNYLKKFFKVGDKIILSGKVRLFRTLQMNSPDYEIISDDSEKIHSGRIVPIYPLTQNLNQRLFRKIAKEVVDEYSHLAKDILPADIKQSDGLIDIKQAIKNIHFPQNFFQQKRARERLVFDEFFILQVGIALRRHYLKKSFTGRKKQETVKKDLAQEFKKIFPFTFTAAQQKVIKEIEKDIAGEQPMNRLIQGDVGSGKTVIAIYALLLALERGYQGAFMAPTAILAEQHYFTLQKILLPLNINIGLLISELSPKTKAEVLKKISGGEIDIIIGTHSLIQKDAQYKNLGLVVIDEQHKFGVQQRAELGKKGARPHCLIMSATPIPRTLALTVYGDLDISLIDELPSGRQSISTYWLKEKKREGLYNFIREEIKKGRQAYIVYPLIEKSEKIELKNAEEHFEYLKEIFADLNLGLLHGRMGKEEKDEVMRRFSGKEKPHIDILVSTTVIEVGLDIPNASIMVIEDAEHFGLSQLHQLRGRIGRGSFKSYCFLLANPKTEEGVKRLNSIVRSQDGFQIAEDDLQQRGVGEFFGQRQHGLPELRIGDILKDVKIMERAKVFADELVQKDYCLSLPEHQLIKQELRERLGDRWGLVSVG
ncbi:MAG: ATP-dependent DNA helicase RecG [Candidatus Omnitrophica bacterium]|nr:ATP-dependent DNA helicase RecG [Candidatus Omnitrophota bacterium]